MALSAWNNWASHQMRLYARGMSTERAGSSNNLVVGLNFQSIHGATDDIEILNISRNPAATWEADAQPFKVERNPLWGTASLKLDTQTLAESDIKAGDVVMARFRMQDGSFSKTASVTIDPNTWSRTGIWYGISPDSSFMMKSDTASFSALISGYRTTDGRAPVVLASRVTQQPSANGKVGIVFDNAVETESTIVVTNTRTREQARVTYSSYEASKTGGKQSVEIAAEPGDVLTVEVIGEYGDKSAPLALHVAPTLSPLALMLRR